MPEDDLPSVQQWFAEHVTLEGKPYTLDQDQTRAVLDFHKNTLVTARAGSGKTRVIVAKIAYLVARRQIPLSHIIAFMFNRTAAAEVNARIAAVQVDGRSLCELDAAPEKTLQDSPSQPAPTPSDSEPPAPVRVASTFHKFALDTVRLFGQRPQIISESTQLHLISEAFDRATAGQQFTPKARHDQLRLIASFISRAGQRFCTGHGLADLKSALANSIGRATADSILSPADREKSRQRLTSFYRTAYCTYYYYLASLRPPQTDFNRLMASATGFLNQAASAAPVAEQPNQTASASRPIPQLSSLEYILIDEYQDFSFLFFALIKALRANCPAAHLFAVGDDWQAINRFAGSDVDYFINFASYFPEDTINIPLMTNYRSAKGIVEHANDFMLRYYDRHASRARAFSKEKGKITYGNHRRLKFDATDIRGDGLGDGRYQNALLRALPESVPVDERFVRQIIPIAKLLKRTLRVLKTEHNQEILLLHRHNFTSVPEITLPVFRQALVELAVDENILTPEHAQQNLRIMTMHKSKGLESEVVILLEANHDILLGHHADIDLFEVFGDNSNTERADQQRLIYVALTRAKKRLYILSGSRRPPC